MSENTDKLRAETSSSHSGTRRGTTPQSGRDSLDIELIQDVCRLTGFQRDVLFVVGELDGTEPSGSDIESRLRERRPDDVSHGSLYRNLRQLHEEGYIAKSPIDGRTYSYRLTERTLACLEAYREWMATCLETLSADEGSTCREGVSEATVTEAPTDER